MSDEPQFDPDTCIHARELRAMGAPIKDTIPDCGWVPRSSIQQEDITVRCEDGVFKGRTRCTFTEPFRWIEVDITITEDGEVINTT